MVLPFEIEEIVHFLYTTHYLFIFLLTVRGPSWFILLCESWSNPGILSCKPKFYARKLKCCAYYYDVHCTSTHREWKHVNWHFRQILSLANYFRFFQACLFFLSFLAFFLMYKNNSFGRNYKNFNKNKLIIYSYIFVSHPAKHTKEL